MKIILFIIMVLSADLYPQEFRFVREDITFRIDSAFFYVDGYYWFVNLSDKEIKKEIYFPISPAGGETDSVEVNEVSRFYYPGIHNFSANGFGFTAQVSPHDTSVYRIKYRQKIIGDSTVYILLSTQQWNMPLDIAEYKLLTMNNIKLHSASYDYDKIYTINNNQIYYWKRYNFMPGRDMIFHFTR